MKSVDGPMEGYTTPMRILVADDDRAQRAVTGRALEAWGFSPTLVEDGTKALEVLEHEPRSMVALLDWMMPGLHGIDVCRELRTKPTAAPRYLILLTSRDAPDDVVNGLRAGADDYVRKPFHREELQARLTNGVRILELQDKLEERVRALEGALRDVQQLRRLLPICSYCKRVRNDQNYWTQVEAYLTEHLDLRFSHGICPSCYEDVASRELEKLGP
ncbi:MAG: response regulator transcription factor [Myxococcota bacterium]